ncbi:hypothetical protein [Streptomyces sp. NPDC005898]|uniref:hypothetical protein n=1 Tax=Streptomyces sp. NPDC005898 TaxID=3157082 RepID=UPI0033C947F6
MTAHPLPVGTRVSHTHQEWARRLPDGTAPVIDRQGPWPDGSWEYHVRTALDFSRRPGPHNPEIRTTWWPSHATTSTKAKTMNDTPPKASAGHETKEAAALHTLLSNALTLFHGDTGKASASLGLYSLWARVSPEVRRDVLLRTAWEARAAQAGQAETLSTAFQYVRVFTRYAAEWAQQYPEGSRPSFCSGMHSAHIAASSLAFDRDDLKVSLEAALLLIGLSGQPEANS